MIARNSQNLITESLPVRILLIMVTFIFLILFIILPITMVFMEALSKGIGFYLATFSHSQALLAIKLTLIVSCASVACNLLFGLAASWALTKFEFKGKTVLITLIDLPFSVSPVIAGLIYVLLFGTQSFIGSWLIQHGVRVIFAVPGLIIATTFVTLPFVVRELLPLMEKQGIEEEEIAILLGANGWQTFWRVTFPNIKWGLLYGVLLCNARAMGEFGAVSVVSGHIRGATITLPLYVEILYNEYNYVAAFAVSSLLTLLAIVTLFLKTLLRKKVKN